MSTPTVDPLPPPPQLPSPNELRMPPIAANLLPAEVVESRRERKVMFGVLSALAAVLVAVAGWYGLSLYQTAGARTDLNSAQDTARTLQTQTHKYDSVLSTQAKSQAIDKQLSTLLANDLSWSKLLTGVSRAVPKGVSLTGISATLTASKNPSTTKPGASGTGAAKTVGGLTISGTASSKTQVAVYIDSLGQVPGVANPLLSSITTQEDKVQFTVAADISGAALGGRYSTATGTGSGGN